MIIYLGVYTMKKISALATFILSLLLISAPVFGQSKIEEIEQYEIRSYDPLKSGLTDLVFEARIDNVTEMLNKTKVFGNLTDVHFKIYWLSPSQYKIEVMGLPKGFQEVRDDLTSLIKGKLEFIIPERFSDKFKGYTLKAEPVANGKLIKAIDTTYTLSIPEVDILFDATGRLKTLETKAVYASTKTEFFQSPKGWSNNKLVMDKVISVSKQGPATLTVTNSIEYTTVSGMGFPSAVTVKNVSEVIIPANGKEKVKKIKNDTGTSIRFSKYEVNTGKAQRFMVDGLRR
jgi:hypothetical protein